jgi:hypothetical protein
VPANAVLLRRTTGPAGRLHTWWIPLERHLRNAYPTEHPGEFLRAPKERVAGRACSELRTKRG